jgi:hypothetical protein
LYSKTSSSWKNKETQGVIKTTKAPSKLATQQRRGVSDTRISNSTPASKLKTSQIENSSKGFNVNASGLKQ